MARGAAAFGQLWRQTLQLLRQWLKQTDRSPEKPLLPNARGGVMTRAGVAHRLRQAAAIAAVRNPSLLKCRISPHSIRHTTAMHLLQSGVDLSVIARWLDLEHPNHSSIPPSRPGIEEEGIGNYQIALRASVAAMQVTG